MSNDLVIYHANCADGLTAAWVCRKFLKGAEFFAASYPPNGEDTELPDVTDRDVLMVDFCVGREQLLRLHGDAKSLQVLDHHTSHEDDCEGLDFCTFDMEQSGAGLAWRYFRGASRPPWIVAYVEDRDLWRFALPNSKAVNAYIGTHEYDFASWDAVARGSKETAAARGESVLTYIRKLSRLIAKEARRVPFAGYDDVPVVNVPPMLASEVCALLAEDAPFAVGWFQLADGLYQYSLRSGNHDRAFDVSVVAKMFGGGGRPQTAGFLSRLMVLS